MSARVDRFCDELRDGLNTLEKQVEVVKSNLQQLPEQGEQALRKTLLEARSKIDAQRKKVEQAQANLKARAEQRIDQAKEAINEWKEQREVGKLNSRADRAEQYAADAVYIAIAALNEAEEAIVDAVMARIEAENAGAPAAATR